MVVAILQLHIARVQRHPYRDRTRFLPPGVIGQRELAGNRTGQRIS